MDNDVRGVGPRAGIDFNYYFASEWAFKGGISGAFLYCSYNVVQKTSGWQVVSSVTSASQFKLKDKDQLVRTNFDGYFGLGWERWVNKNRNRLSLALLCESSYWFGINQLMDLEQLTSDATNPNTVFVAEKRHGDLSFFGGTLHFQVDF